MPNTMQHLAFVALDVLERRTGWAPRVVVRVGIERFAEAFDSRLGWRWKNDDPVVIEVPESLLAEQDADRIRSEVWRALTVAAGPRVYPHIWASAMMGPHGR